MLQDTLQIDPGRKLNLFKRILFFPNVTAFKIAKTIPSLSDYRRNYRARSFGLVMVVSFEILIFNFFFPKIDRIYFNRTCVAIVCVNGLIELVFSKDVFRMAFDYYTYYSRFLFYISFILAIVGFCWIFNDLIGK